MNIMRKKIVMIALACMALLMTQCKKKIVEQPCGGLTGEQIVVTLSADNGGEKTNITETGLVTWDLGDKLYVVAETSGYLGYLSAQNTGTSAYFTGSISAFSGSAQDLHFYYVGKNKTIADGSVSYDYSIASQTLGTLDDIENNFHLMHGCIENVAAGQTSLGCVTMQNMMTILKLNFSAQSGTTLENTIKCRGGYSQMTVDLKTGGTTLTKGDITLGGTSSKSTYYMVVIPGKQVFDYLQDVNNDGVYDYKNDKGALTRHFTFEAGKIYNEKSIVIGTLSCLSGEFTVANGTKVRFSPGNLMYQASTNTWRFAPEQYLCIHKNGFTYSGTTYESGNGTTSSYRYNQTKWIDLFGWGTSGYNECQPWYATDDPYVYGPSDGSLTGTNDKYDWGVNNIINNLKSGGNDEPGVWRTLTEDELVYLLNVDGSTSNYRQDAKRFTKARINYTGTPSEGRPGLIIFPDGYSGTVPTNLNSYINKKSAPNNQVDITPEQLKIMEEAGAVFLPSVCRRDGTTVYNDGAYGMYWTSTKKSNTEAFDLYVVQTTSNQTIKPNDYRNRDKGYAVRLVH